MGFGTTNKMRVDDDELKLRQWVVELKNKGKNPEMIRDYLTQYQGYKTEAVQNAFNIAGMEYQPPEQTIQTPQATPQAQQQDPNQTYLGGQPFSIENSADFSLYQGEKEKQEEKSALVDFGLKAVDKKLTNIDKAAEHKSLDDAVGPSITKIFSRGIGLGGKQDFTGIVNQIVSVDALDSLIEAKSRGATFGALSDREMDLLKSAATKIGSWGVAPDGKTVAYDISEKAFKAELASMQESAKLLQQGLLEHKKEMEANPLVGLPKQAVQQEAQQGKQGLHLETPDDARKYLEANPDAPESAGIREKLKEFDSKPLEGSAFSDIIGDIDEAATGIYESAKTRWQQGKDAQDLPTAFDTEKEANFMEKIVRVWGQEAGFAADTLGEAVKLAVKAVSSPEQEKQIKEVVANVGTKVMETKTVEGLMAYYQEAKENDPGAVANIEALANILDIAVEATGVGAAINITKQTGKRTLGAAKDVAETGSRYIRKTGTKSVAKEAAEEASKVTPGIVSKTGEFIDDSALAVIEKSTGMPKDTIQKMIKNPEKFTKEEMAAITRDATFGKVNNNITKRINEVSETGAGYDVIRGSSNIVNVDQGFIKNTLQDAFGLKIIDGKLVASTKSLTRETADLNALQKFYDVWGDVKTMDADEFLNMRSDLAGLAKFDKISGKTGASETIAKRLRADLNNKYRNQVDGLEKLDAKYTPERAELQAIKKDYFKADGTIKDGAFTKLANITNKGNEQRLARLKKIIPGIEEEVNMLRAVESIRGLNSNQTGQYVRSMLAGGAGGSIVGGPVGSGIGTIVGMLLANPSSAVGIVRAYGNFRKFKTSVINKTIDKMKTGKPLTSGEKSLVNDAIDHAEDNLKKRDSLKGR